MTPNARICCAAGWEAAGLSPGRGGSIRRFCRAAARRDRRGDQQIRAFFRRG